MYRRQQHLHGCEIPRAQLCDCLQVPGQIVLGLDLDEPLEAAA